MKTILLVFTFSAATLFFFACKPTQYTTENLPDRQLRWGSGGGYVGKETTYTLLDNGQVFVRETGGKLAETTNTKPKKAKVLYETMGTLGLSTLDFQHPGNIYNFIEVLNGTDINRISWGEKGHAVDQQVQDLYRQLNELVKK
ncbi:MAG: hypothetical protein IPJ82_01920 [Lewinellaceae bacterium]|nr:hypothetical protein [Lewinellaceae bacterium]